MKWKLWDGKDVNAIAVQSSTKASCQQQHVERMVRADLGHWLKCKSAMLQDSRGPFKQLQIKLKIQGIYRLEWQKPWDGKDIHVIAFQSSTMVGHRQRHVERMVRDDLGHWFSSTSAVW